MGAPQRRGVHARFWSKVQKTDSCWLWLASKGEHGYGWVALNNKNRHASRAAWELTNGPIPKGMFVLHRCDNPPCVRPDHLFLGTTQDNANEMSRKGRSLYGERNRRAKLTEAQVLEIRCRYKEEQIKQQELAGQY